MNRPILFFAALLFALSTLNLISAGPVQAQFAGDTIFHKFLDIEVTATRTARPVSDVPARVDVLSSRDWDLIPALRVDDKLRTVSGVNVTSSMGMFTMRPKVTIRGISGDEQARTLVLIDGIPINTSDSGGVNWNSIDTGNIEQVEVFKGPGSSLYGSNAMGGVINIITRTPEKPLSATASLSYGTFNTGKSRINLTSRPSDRITLQLGGFYNTSDGYNTTPDSLRSEPGYEHSVPRYLEEGGLNASASWKFSDLLQLGAAFDLFRDKRGEGTEIQAPDGMYRHFDMSRMRLLGSGQHNDFSYRFTAFFQREDYFRISERIRGGDYERFDVDSDRDDLGITLDLFHDTGTLSGLTGSIRHSFTAGFDARAGYIDGGDFYQTSPDKVTNRGTMRFLAGYIQDEMSLLDQRLHIQLGLRFDHARFYDGYFRANGENVQEFAGWNGDLDENSWSTFSPRVAVRYNPNRSLSGYLSYGRGFRASVLDDLTRTGWSRVGPKIANPELGPETVDTYEIGGEWHPHWRWRIAPSTYFAHGQDFLYYIATGDRLWENGPMIHRRENVSSIRTAGAELDVNFIAGNRLNLSASYSYSHSEILSFPGREDLEGNTLTYDPGHQAKSQLQWRGKWFDAGLTGRYKSPQYISDDNTNQLDDYVTFDMILSRSIRHGLSASLEVIDIMDSSRMESSFHMSPGRIINATVTYDWPK